MKQTPHLPGYKITANGRCSEIIAIVCSNEYGQIGYKNDLICRCKEDMRFFKEQTTGYAVIMGSNTFDSLNRKPLPGRYNIVLTHNKDKYKDYKAENLIFVDNPDDALVAAHDYLKIFIIGGAEIYRLFKDNTERLLWNIVVCGQTIEPKMEGSDIKYLYDLEKKNFLFVDAIEDMYLNSCEIYEANETECGKKLYFTEWLKSNK